MDERPAGVDHFNRAVARMGCGPTALGFYFLTTILARSTVGGTFAMIGFFYLAAWLCHGSLFLFFSA